MCTLLIEITVCNVYAIPDKITVYNVCTIPGEITAYNITLFLVRSRFAMSRYSW